MSERFDAIIIGGGPAGSVTALLLAQCGWSIALVERRAPGTSKTCGHCLNPKAFPTLQRAGVLPAVRDAAAGTTRKLHIHLGDHAQFTGSMLPSHDDEPGLLLSRKIFDQLLLDQAADAGVRVFQPASARIDTLQTGQSHITVGRNELRGRLIIGADGLRSAVARAANLDDAAQRGNKYGFAFTIESDHASALQFGTVAMFVASNGYLGVVREGDNRLHVAALVSTSHSSVARSPAAFVQQLAEVCPTLRNLGLERCNEASIRDMTATGPIPCNVRSVANECVALVGDAAGYIEPFTGEGMAWAIQSAEVLESVLSEYEPGRWDGPAAAEYQRRWQSIIGRRHRMCRMVAWALARPWIVRALLGASIRHPQLAQRAIHVVAQA